MKRVILRDLRANYEQFLAVLTKRTKSPTSRKIKTEEGDFVLGPVQETLLLGDRREKYTFLEIPIELRPGPRKVAQGDIAFRFDPKLLTDGSMTLMVTCYQPATELYFDKLVRGIAEELGGEVEPSMRRPIRMISGRLIDDGKFSELIEILARSTADEVQLPRDALMKVLLTQRGVPATLLEEVARDDSVFAVFSRRILLELLLNLGFKAPAPTQGDKAAQTRHRGRQPKYDFETMCQTVLDWYEMRASSSRLDYKDDSQEDFEDDLDVIDKALTRRMTKAEFLANRFNDGAFKDMPVRERKLDYWAKQFETGEWQIPPKLEAKWRKRK